jgi:phosphatidylserine/phosphatidylglycerophosphate/cardiolipin synthase-like enzyme
MAKFLNTSGTNFYLEKLIKGANERLILISPFLQINDRVKELLEDKNRLKLDIRIVYGKVELPPEEITWLRGLEFVRTSFCKNLHAKCYLNEQAGIITSMNLYEFSQINNNEMGILFLKAKDIDLYKEAFEEAQRIIRISEEFRLTVEKIEKEIENETTSQTESTFGKLTTHRLAQKLGIKSNEIFPLLVKHGYLEKKEGKHFLSNKGKQASGEFRWSKNGPFFLWPQDFQLDSLLIKG